MAELLKNLWAPWDMSYVRTLFWLILDTLGMAILASVLAIVISVPLAFLSARKTTPWLGIAFAVRAILAFLRAIPDLVWALAFVSATGLGPIPGVSALTVTTIAFLAKFHYESIDVVSQGPIDGIAAAGGGWLAQRFYGVLPQATPDFVGQWVYSVDSNVRSATILGYVGAGGIGFDFSNAIRVLDYGRIVMITLSIFIVVTIFDRLSDLLRRRIF
jgi:phosphonate transport system permease protein